MRSPSAERRRAAGRPRRMFRLVVVLRHSTPPNITGVLLQKDNLGRFIKLWQQPPCIPASSRCGARLPRCARNDNIRRVAANNPLLRHRQCSSLRHRERFSPSVIARSAATWQSRSGTNAPTPPRLPRCARHDSIRRVAANNPLLRHRQCSSLRHRERFSFCHCEERSDVAIPFRNQTPYPSEIAALRSQ